MSERRARRGEGREVCVERKGKRGGMAKHQPAGHHHQLPLTPAAQMLRSS